MSWHDTVESDGEKEDEDDIFLILCFDVNVVFKQTNDQG